MAVGIVGRIGEWLAKLSVVITLGSFNWIGLPLLGLLLALAYFGFRGMAWVLLWIPYYSLVLWLGFRKLKHLEAQAKLQQAAQVLQNREQLEQRVSEDARAQRIERLFQCKEFGIALGKACHSVGKILPGEEWRLGLIVPGHDRVGKLGLELITPVKTAVLHQRTTFGTRHSRLVITEGYSLTSHEIILGRPPSERSCLKSEVTVRHSKTDERFPLPQMLHNEGFPIARPRRDKDPDPFVTITGGVWVQTKTGEQKAIKTGEIGDPALFVQRTLIDDEGNVIYLGFDDGYWTVPNFSVTMKPTPTFSRFLEETYGKDYTPLLWYHTSPVPFASELWMPILDIPLTSYAIPELVIDPETKKGILFIAKSGADLEECMQRLQALWETELAACDRSLLTLMKNEDRLWAYLKEKEEILGRNFLWEEYDLQSFLHAAQPSAPQRALQIPMGLVKVVSSRQQEKAREKSYREQLAELWEIAHSPEAKKATSRGGWLGALVSLPWALINMGNLFVAGFIVLTGFVFGETFGFSSWLERRGRWEAVKIMNFWGVIGFGLAMLTDYLLTRDASRIWGWGAAGYLIGRRWGFRRWWRQEAGWVHYESIRHGPIEEYYWEYPDPKAPDPQCRFRIRYPEGWTLLRESDPPVGTAVHFLSPLEDVEINIVVGPFTSVVTEEQYLQSIDEIVRSLLVDATLHSYKIIRLEGAGVQAVEVVYTRYAWVRPMPFKVRCKVKKVAVWRQSTEFFLTLAASPRHFSKYEPIFDRCLQAFRFT